MIAPEEMPLQDVLQALSRTPVTQPQLRAALATTCARWHLARSEEAEAIRHLGHALEMVPDLRPAMRLLYRIYLDRGDVRSAVMYLDQEIRATRHPREAAALYRERGLLVEAHFHDLSAAQQCYQAALKATPRDLAVLRSVERVSLARGDVFWLIANLEAQLEVLQDPGTIAGVLHDLALLEARHNGDLALAGDLLLGALEPFPRHLVLIADLFRLAEVAGDPELMLHALELEAEARPPTRRAMPLARASVTLREHKERAAALQLLQSAAHAQPHNYSLWRSLEELAMATSRYDIALEACVGQLRAMADEEEPAARAELFYRLGKLALFRLDRPVDGLASMRRALRLFPGHVPAIEDTGRYLNANGMWAQLLELIKLEIAAAKDAGLTANEVALAHLRAGGIMEDQLGELEGARQFYHDAISASASFRPARDRLERLLHQRGDLDGLRDHYRDELEQAKAAPRRAFLMSVLAQLHAHDEDPAEAIQFLVGLLKHLPDHLPSLQRLARLLARAGRSKDLLRVTEHEIKLTVSPGRSAKLLHRAGELALGLDDPAKARKCFEQALELVDDHLPSLGSLGALLRQTGDDEALVALLRKEMLYANDRARQVGLQLEIAIILGSRLDRPEEALSELLDLLDRWPRHLPALHAAERLASALDRQDVVLELLEQHIASVTGPRTRALLLHRAAQIRSRAGDADGAIRDLVRALELWPQLGVARARLLRLYERSGRSRELQAFAEAGLTNERGADDRRAMALQLAELTPKPIVAIQYLGAVAEARPEDYVTQLRLARSCRQARRPSREAGALAAAADRIAEQLSPADPGLLALRYRAARAEEAAGNLEAADQGYARILDVEPGYALARRGRIRIKERKKEAALARSARDLERAASEAKSPAEKAAYLNIAADLDERRRDLPSALSKVEKAVEACGTYVPALHAQARLLERAGSPEQLQQATATLERLAKVLHNPGHQAAALARAGSLSLQLGTEHKPNPKAWKLFVRALELDPGSDPAFRGLRRTQDTHGTDGVRGVLPALTRRLDALRRGKRLTEGELREAARLGGAVDGAEAAVRLLEKGMDVAPNAPGIRADLAQAYARLGRWKDVVREIEAALQSEVSPERSAALHYFAADAHDRAGNPTKAVEHYLDAGRGGFHPRHALLAADQIAAKAGALKQRVAALQLLVDLGDGPERVRSLRALADIHRGPLAEPDVAVDLMRELLLLRPTDIDVLTELRRLLEKLDRHEEAIAAMLAGVAHHRAWLRSQGVRSDLGGGINPAPVLGLLRLFDALGEMDGVYVAAGVLEDIAGEVLPDHRTCNRLVTEPWPLPKAQEGRPFDVLIGDLPGSAALDLLREGVAYLGVLPAVEGAPEPPAARPLPTTSSVVMVTRSLASAMGVAQPQVYLDSASEDTVVARVGAAPAIVVGRRINSAPFAPVSRDRIGRALLRLSTGGDRLHSDASGTAVLAILVALCQAVGLDVEPPPDFDWAFASAVTEALPEADSLADLHEYAVTFAESIDNFDPKTLMATLHMAEDRAGAVCAADPRPAVALLQESGLVTGPRGTTLIGYLLSDDHLTLRRTLGYQLEINRGSARVEEASA